MLFYITTDQINKARNAWIMTLEVIHNNILSIYAAGEAVVKYLLPICSTMNSPVKP